MKLKDILIITFISLLIAFELTAVAFIGGDTNSRQTLFLTIMLFIFVPMFCWMVSYKQIVNIKKELEKINSFFERVDE